MKSKLYFVIIISILTSCTMNPDKQGGIIFFQTQNIEKLHDFYINEVGCTLWLDQGGCQIYQHGNMLFGFCQRENADLEGMITFFYTQKSTVDDMYVKFKSIATSEPKDNPKYKIYHFFATDPEGRAIEFQYFNNEIKDF